MKKLLHLALIMTTLIGLAGCTTKSSNSISGVTGKDDRVTVKTARTTLPGYLVLHQLDNGQPGKIIGLSKPYPLGKISQATIASTERLQSGTKYAVVLHHDNSDLKFIASQDLPAKNSQNQIVMVQFTAR